MKRVAVAGSVATCGTTLGWLMVRRSSATVWCGVVAAWMLKTKSAPAGSVTSYDRPISRAISTMAIGEQERWCPCPVGKAGAWRAGGGKKRGGHAGSLVPALPGWGPAIDFFARDGACPRRDAVAQRASRQVGRAAAYPKVDAVLSGVPVRA